MPQHAAQYIKTLLQQSNPRITVQKMCDDCPTLVKSTVDKFLAGQTTDTSWSNVMTMVKYLGGSLDKLAEIQTNVILPDPPPPSVPQKDHSAGVGTNDLLDRFRALHVDSRNALVAQHTAAILHVREQAQSIVLEKDKHLKSMEKGRDFWRTLSCILIGVVVLASIWLVWEFSNFEDGLTGHFLRMLIQSMSGAVS